MAAYNGNLALSITQETDGITCRPETLQCIILSRMRTAHNKTTPTIYIFFPAFHKKEPAGSEKQVINSVWPYCVAKLLIRHVHGHAAYYVIACNCTCAFLWLLVLLVQLWCSARFAQHHHTALASVPRVLHDS